MSDYGYFDDDAREYVLTNPRTPVKWINYIGTLQFGGLVDHTGGLLICKKDPATNRITKYLPQTPDGEFKGSTVYLRKHNPDGSYRLFSALFVPTLDPYDRFECRFGLGYSRFVTELYGIRTVITTFVPDGAETALQDITITNLDSATQTIDVIPVVEYTHFDALKQFTNADWVPQTMQSWAVEQGEFTLLCQAAFMKRGYGENYLTSNHPVDSFESERRRFLGDAGYGSWSQPGALGEAHLGNSEALRGDNIGALLHALGEMAPGESRRVVVQLGQQPEAASAAEIARWRDPAQVDAAFADLARGWDAYLGRFQVRSPDPDFDRMVNVYNPRQVFVTQQWSRYLSLYQLGLGTRGIGMRDSSQDVIGVIANAPDAGAEMIRMLLAVQNRDGSAQHQFNPVTMMANAGDARETEDRPDYYSDDHLWIILTVCQYLLETGNLSFLDEIVPFYDRDGDGEPAESGTIRQHLRRAIDFTRSDTGAHGLPLLGFADWNDTVNLPAGSESVFTACLYGRVLLRLIELAEYEADLEALDYWEQCHREMAEAVNTEAWDGEWYVRYFDQNGGALGSRTNQVGQIFTNAQSWAVLSGFAPEDRALRALESVSAKLNTKYGIKLAGPGYPVFDPRIGGVTTFPPGAKENGGIFLHANPWVVIAETEMGNGDRAFSYWAQLNPVAKNDTLDVYECEPFVYAQNILGDEHPQFGLARNSWLTGTASWMYQAATLHILGIRPTYRGLVVDPCLPAAWSGFEVTRVFRDATYEITVHNPDHVSAGVVALTVDGQPRSDRLVPVFGDGRSHTVEVLLG